MRTSSSTRATTNPGGRGTRVPTESDLRVLGEAALAKLDVIVEAAAHKNPLRQQDTQFTIPVGPFTRGLVMAGMTLSGVYRGRAVLLRGLELHRVRDLREGVSLGEDKDGEGAARRAEGRLRLHVRCMPLTSAPGRPCRSGTSRG